MTSTTYPAGEWDNKHFRQLYATNFACLMVKMPVMDISLIDKSDIKSAVNYLYEKLCQCMHDAVRDIKVEQPPPWKSTLSKPSRTRRNWWSYDCKLTRN